MTTKIERLKQKENSAWKAFRSFSKRVEVKLNRLRRKWLKAEETRINAERRSSVVIVLYPCHHCGIDGVYPWCEKCGRKNKPVPWR